MDRFSDRKRRIIMEIANANPSITGKSLSLLLNVSIRTIQTEVAEINQQLFLIHSSNKGYSIDTENYALCSQHIQPTQSYEHLILRKLISSNKPCQIDDLADTFYLSTSSLEKILNSFQPLLTSHDLHISRKKMHIHIEGNELSKRRLINHLIFEETTPTFANFNNLSLYFPNINTGRMKSIIINSISKFNYSVDNAYLSNIIINISIALYRMKDEYYVNEITYHDTASLSVEFQIAQEICEQYAEHWHIAPTNADLVHIATLLSGQIKPLSEISDTAFASEVMTSEFLNKISDILLSSFTYYMLDIDYSDSLYAFALHANNMIIRLRNMQTVTNGILENIKRNCPFIHDVSVHIAKQIGDTYHLYIPDSEIGYISVHIGYLIESATTKSSKIKVALLCHEYHHIMARTKDKLMNQFSELVDISIANFEQEQAITSMDADLFITTAPMTIAGAKTICISPFYTNKDYIEIDRAIHACLKKKQESRYNQLLSSLFHEKLFYRQEDLNTKEAAIKFLGQKIIDFGLCEEGFIDSVLLREELSSTCFFNTFSIPHAVELNAKKTMFCILINKKGIIWDNQKIYIVLMIAVNADDRKRFMEIYNGIVQTLETPEKVKLLISADTHVDFINYLKRH